MIAFVLAYALFLASIVFVAGLRMVSAGATFTYFAVARALALQGCVAALVLWISSLLGPLDARTIGMTGLFLAGEAVFHVVRKLRG